MSIKKISESGFYNLNDLGEFSKLEIENGIKVILFDEGNFSKEIIVGEKSKVKLCGFLQDENDYKMFMRQTGEGSKVKIKYLLLSKNNKKTKATIHSKIESNFSKTDVFVSSLSAENGEIDLDGIIELAPNFRQMAGHLIEENVFLGEKAKIRGIPTLLVKSNEVEASHACKIEKISEDDLFYLRSRGIDKKSAVGILIEAKLKNIFKYIEKEDFYENFLEKIWKEIFD
ncbi:SufD family Fe-S cluster assembly protein [Candidatus Gracilibacteria bacterium]|nr:SufD family Fe-S cluster assembly protein [Candidatus Gracilibacteria bacterium]